MPEGASLEAEYFPKHTSQTPQNEPTKSLPIEVSTALSTLNPQQHLAATALNGSYLVIAGAGSGKTRVITYRTWGLLKMGVPARHILCLTFTNKSAKEMKERIVQMLDDNSSNKKLDKGLFVNTFHALCVRILRNHLSLLQPTKSFNIYDSSDQKEVLLNVLRELNIDENGIDLNTLQEEISNYKNKLIAPEDIIVHTVEEKALKVIYHRYQTFLRLHGAFDFDDLLLSTYLLFRDHPEILEKYQEQYQFIMIDEYQDTNYAQYTILKQLANKHKNIMAVGDDDQSIYSWRGADINNITNLEKDFPNTKIVKLEENYRSTPMILKAANALIKNNNERKDKSLWIKGKEQGEKLSVLKAIDPWDEVEKVAQSILQKIEAEKLSYSSFAIIYRTKSQGKPFEKNFNELEIPYQISGRINFYDRKEIKDVLAFLKILNNPNDDLSLFRILSLSRLGIGRETIKKLSLYAQEKEISFFQSMQSCCKTYPEYQNYQAGKGGLFDMVKDSTSDDSITNSQEKWWENYPFADFKANTIKALESLVTLINDYQKKVHGEDLVNYFKDFLEMMEYFDYLEQVHKESDDLKRKLNNVERLLKIVEQYVTHSKREPSVGDFLIKLAIFFSNDEDEEELFNNNSVNLMTVHAAKGLEFDVVFIVGFEEEIMPFAKDRERIHNLNEERRLCYVAITRAKKECWLSFCTQRQYYGSTIHCEPSRFLSEIPRECLQEVEINDSKDFLSKRKKTHQEKVNQQGNGLVEGFAEKE